MKIDAVAALALLGIAIRVAASDSVPLGARGALLGIAALALVAAGVRSIRASTIASERAKRRGPTARRPIGPIVLAVGLFALAGFAAWSAFVILSVARNGLF